MNIWRRPITSEAVDEKVRSGGRKALLAIATLSALAGWTYAVRGIHDYCRAMSAWSDGASKRNPDDWTPYVILWVVPVLLVLLLGLMARASIQRRSHSPDT